MGTCTVSTPLCPSCGAEAVITGAEGLFAAMAGLVRCTCGTTWKQNGLETEIVEVASSQAPSPPQED